MLKPKGKTKILLLIFLIALFLRIFRLSEFPVGFHADEARVAWNAYSILKTGYDDRGNKFSLYYDTFGDFRPTGIFYMAMPGILAFGQNEFGVRFPSAFFGALTTIALYLFVKEIQKDEKGVDKGQGLSLWASFFLAISPWHISVSRATSEVCISLFLVISGIYFFIKAINTTKRSHFIISLLLLALSYFFYHSSRILVPFFILSLIAFFWKKIKRQGILKRSVLVFLALFLTTIVFSIDPRSRGRFSQVSIFTDIEVSYELTQMPFEEGPNKVFIARSFHNKVAVYLRRFVEEYAKYFSADFLMTDAARPDRYKTYRMGLLTYAEVTLLVLGLVATRGNKIKFLAILLLAAAPLPSALTIEDSPNLHRAFFMTAFFSIIEANGVLALNELKKFKKILFALFFLLFTLNFVYYIHMYYIHSKYRIAEFRNYGAKELAVLLGEIQGHYDRIILTDVPDDPYPWIAFFGKRSPEIFNKDAVEREQGVWMHQNFVFSTQRCPSRDAFQNPDVKRLLVVDASACQEASELHKRGDVKILAEIKRPDQSVAYTLWSKVE